MTLGKGIGERVLGKYWKPAQVAGVLNSKKIAGRCALIDDGTVRCWTTVNMATEMTGLEGVTDLISNGRVICAQLKESKIECWGTGWGLPIGYKLTNIPMPVPEFEGFNGLSLGDSSSCALALDLSVQCWGDNSVGQLGR